MGKSQRLLGGSLIAFQWSSLSKFVSIVRTPRYSMPAVQQQFQNSLCLRLAVTGESDRECELALINS